MKHTKAKHTKHQLKREPREQEESVGSVLSDSPPKKRKKKKREDTLSPMAKKEGGKSGKAQVQQFKETFGKKQRYRDDKSQASNYRNQNLVTMKTYQSDESQEEAKYQAASNVYSASASSNSEERRLRKSERYGKHKKAKKHKGKQRSSWIKSPRSEKNDPNGKPRERAGANHTDITADTRRHTDRQSFHQPQHHKAATMRFPIDHADQSSLGVGQNLKLNFKKLQTQGERDFSDEDGDPNEAEHFRQMSAQLQMYQNQIVQLQSQLNNMNNMSTMHGPFPP